jgi:hypothetical protein
VFGLSLEMLLEIDQIKHDAKEPTNVRLRFHVRLEKLNSGINLFHSDFSGVVYDLSM